jgi:hypothetical protein
MTEETPAPAVPAPPALSAPPETWKGPCEACGVTVEVRERTHWKMAVRDYASYIVCAVCRAGRQAQDRVAECEKALHEATEGSAFLEHQVLPLVRASGIEAAYLILDYYGGVRIRVHDREDGLRLCGVLGGLLIDRHRWKKEQEYNAATFQLHGEVQVGKATVKITIANVAPSPSCRIVTEEIDVPARKEKRVKVVCGDDDAPAP